MRFAQPVDNITCQCWTDCGKLPLLSSCYCCFCFCLSCTRPRRYFFLYIYYWKIFWDPQNLDHMVYYKNEQKPWKLLNGTVCRSWQSPCLVSAPLNHTSSLQNLYCMFSSWLCLLTCLSFCLSTLLILHPWVTRSSLTPLTPFSLVPPPVLSCHDLH